MVFERKKYLDELIAGRGNGLVKIITGVRRYGKSFLLFYIWHNWCWSKVNHQCRLNDYMNCLKSFFSNCHKKGLLSEDMIVFYAKVSIFIILIGYDFAITIPTTSDVNAMQTWHCCKSMSIDRIPSRID